MPEPVPMQHQRECAERELKMRRRAYPRWVEQGRMTQLQADREIRAMEAVVETLRGLEAKDRLI